MRTTFAVIASLLFAIVPRAADAQDGKAALEAVAKAMGADIVTSVQYDASGTVWSLGQSAVPGGPWPKFNAKLSRSINWFEAHALTRSGGPLRCIRWRAMPPGCSRNGVPRGTKSSLQDDSPGSLKSQVKVPGSELHTSG